MCTVTLKEVGFPWPRNPVTPRPEPGAVGSGARFGRWLGRDALWAYAFVAPQIVGLLGFVVLPVLAAFLLSFARWDLGKEPTWVGVENYARQVADPLFWRVLGNTVYFTVGFIPSMLALSLLLALGLNQRLRFVVVYRALYFLPAITSSVAIALVWAWLYNPDFGLINLALAAVGVSGPKWTASLAWAMPSVIIVSVWHALGYNAVVFLAGLKAIPRELYEAAKVDGANRWALARHVTVPMLTPTIFFVLVVATIGSFQVFNTVYMLTGGGPGDATNVLVKHMFDVGFRFFRLGEAAAIAWTLFLIIVALTVVQFRFARWVHYE